MHSDGQSSQGIECLEESPYSLPGDDAARERVGALLQRESRVRDRLLKARQELQAMRLLSTTGDLQAAREIYESNAIEGLGPDLSATWRTLQSDTAKGFAREIDARLLADSMNADADMHAVLGLYGARVLADRLQDGSSRTWSETDLRSLHATICAGESYAGQYKRFHVLIGGESAHEPHLPIAVSQAMHELVDWWGTSTNGSSILKAAAVHAWLTHIHPFEDGNGRMARLLANVTMNSGGLAPAIVKHTSQRGPYLDALRHSDVGGDILPLASLFLDIVNRYAREISKPKRLREVFFAEVDRRKEGYFAWWQDIFEQFTSRLFAELRLAGYEISLHGRLDSESFRMLQDLDHQGNAWFASIRDQEQREVLLWFGYPTLPMRLRKEPVPSLFLSVPDNEPWSLRPYRGSSGHETGGLTEIMVVPGMPARVYTLLNERQRFGGQEDAAAEIAEVLSAAFRHKRVPQRLARHAKNSPGTLH